MYLCHTHAVYKRNTLGYYGTLNRQINLATKPFLRVLQLSIYNVTFSDRCTNVIHVRLLVVEIYRNPSLMYLVLVRKSTNAIFLFRKLAFPELKITHSVLVQQFLTECLTQARRKSSAASNQSRCMSHQREAFEREVRDATRRARRTSP